MFGRSKSKIKKREQNKIGDSVAAIIYVKKAQLTISIKFVTIYKDKNCFFTDGILADTSIDDTSRSVFSEKSHISHDRRVRCLFGDSVGAIII